MTYYLSGPMTGLPEYNFPTFAKAAAWLRNYGLTILSAHEISHAEPPGVVGSLPYETYLRDDVVELAKCQALILLPGWTHSTGARMELELALTWKLPIFYLLPLDGEMPYLLCNMTTGTV